MLLQIKNSTGKIKIVHANEKFYGKLNIVHAN